MQSHYLPRKALLNSSFFHSLWKAWRIGVFLNVPQARATMEEACVQAVADFAHLQIVGLQLAIHPMGDPTC